MSCLLLGQDDFDANVAGLVERRLADEADAALEQLHELDHRGFIRRLRSTTDGPLVSVSSSGAHYLRTHRRRSP